MNPYEFEKHLQSQPMRPVPPHWRQELLSAARQASVAHNSARAGHRAHASHSLLSTINSKLSTFLWPHPAAWAGLAAIWVIVLGLNFTTQDAALRIAKHTSPASPELLMAFQEQQRLLNELIGPHETPSAEPPKPSPARPRSDRRTGLMMV